MPKEAKVFTSEESTELLQFIAANMVMKDDLSVIVREIVTDVVTDIIDEKVPPMIRGIIQEEVPPMLGKLKNEIMDYVDKKDREYKGELNLTIQKEDKKVDAVITTLHESKIIDTHKSQELKSLTPFPAIS